MVSFYVYQIKSDEDEIGTCTHWPKKYTKVSSLSHIEIFESENFN